MKEIFRMSKVDKMDAQDRRARSITKIKAISLVDSPQTAEIHAHKTQVHF